MYRKIPLFQLISDLHLKSSFLNLYKPSAPNLVIAGDLGSPFAPEYEKFIAQTSKDHDNVILIAGNHEYYSQRTPYDAINRMIKDISKRFNNVHFLYNSKITLSETVIIGSTLWSHIQPDQREIISKIMTDFRKIYKTPDTLMDVDDINNMFLRNVDYIKGEIIRHKDDDVIIVSHHLPSFKLIHPYYQTPSYRLWSSAFATDLESLMLPNVKVWMCGHTHRANSTKINNCRLVVNPYGYIKEQSGFNPALII